MKFTVTKLFGLTTMAAIFCGIIALYPPHERMRQAVIWAGTLFALWSADRWQR